VQSDNSLPYSQASENNKAHILAILRRHLEAHPELESVLEIGSGTAQHGEFFSSYFTNMLWQCSDIPSNLPVTRQQISACQRENLPAPIALDVNDSERPSGKYDSVFTANSLHIMPYASVAEFFQGLRNNFSGAGFVFVYGPFKYQGDFTTESNARFDLWLKHQNPESGIRDFERIVELAEQIELTLLEGNAMPANNQLLVFRNS